MAEFPNPNDTDAHYKARAADYLTVFALAGEDLNSARRVVRFMAEQMLSMTNIEFRQMAGGGAIKPGKPEQHGNG